MEQESNNYEENKVEGLSISQRFIGMFAYPKRVYAYLEENPKIWSPMLMIAALIIITAIPIFVPYKEALIIGIKAQYETMNMEMPAETISAVGTATAIATILFAPVRLIIGSLLSALYYYICSLIFKGKAKYKQVLSVVLHANIISSLAFIVGLIFMGITKDSMMSSVTSAISLLNPDQVMSFMGGFLQKFEIFNIWSHVLVIIGLNQVTKLDKEKNILIVVLGFIFFALMMGGYVHVNLMMLENMNVDMY